MRHTPRLIFFEDNSLERGAEVLHMIEEVSDS